MCKKLIEAIRKYLGLDSSGITIQHCLSDTENTGWVVTLWGA